MIPSLLLASADKLNPAIEEAYEGAKHSLELHPFEGGIEGIFPVYGNLQMSVPDFWFLWRGKKIKGEKPVLVFREQGGKTQKTWDVSGKTGGLLVRTRSLNLKRGKEYEWFLGRLEGEEVIAQSRVFRFRILSKEESRRLQKAIEQNKAKFLKAQIYFNYRLYHDMVALLEPRYKMAPSESLRKLLFLGYVRLGRHHEAKKFGPKSGR